MATTKETSKLPPLKRPGGDAETGALRIGDGYVTDEFPTLRRPDQNADKGKSRIGDGYITGQY